MYSLTLNTHALLYYALEDSCVVKIKVKTKLQTRDKECIMNSLIRVTY